MPNKIKGKINVAVIGGHRCSKQTYEIAKQTGKLIAREGWILVCGGGPGIMEAACCGAKSQGGLTVGILPSYDGKEANKFLDVQLTTGLGYARNILVVRSAQAVIAIDGEYGTLSEIAFAFSAEGGPAQIKNSGGGNDPMPIVGIKTWEVDGLKQTKNAKEAVEYIKEQLKKRRCDV